ncbi:lipoyl(octanoyl) transferase LipB [Schaalia sp. 19OD2882]|uniref:lipoyl(octanoyl) transferase LipB n=1 Tax=Schaalia sp. 19OD2882 TaxID=2794089 RepID=UPI001C1EAB70|nr:lipoyl(octanoyl) transferase LipB [Schaalia sp. 19OD2882]QWW18787.1 lipoyl(octanoyl) transferase LipB [Schaalia sp. 19OD2882]
MRIIDLLPLGLTDYTEVDALQRRLHRQVLEGAEDALVVAQFTPTWTAGRHTRPEDVPDTTLAIIHTDRAGSATWHGPGQVVVYPVVRLAEPVDTVKWIRAVEAGVIDCLRRRWSLPVQRVEGRAGVWILEDGGPDRKICAMGLKVARGATLHGVALNVAIDMSDAFRGIIPCGLADATVASLHTEGVHTDLACAARALVPQLVDSIQPCLARPGTPVAWVNGADELDTARREATTGGMQ